MAKYGSIKGHKFESNEEEEVNIFSASNNAFRFPTGPYLHFYARLPDFHTYLNLDETEKRTSAKFFIFIQERSLKKFKQIKWWCQSFLVGVPKLVCGFRDDDGIVEKIVQVSSLIMKDSAPKTPIPPHLFSIP